VKNIEIVNKDLFSLTKQAFETDDVLNFLQGNGIYACSPNRFVSASIPTDFGYILEFGVYPFYIASEDSAVIDKVRNAIISLSNGDTVQVWIAYSLLWSQIYKEKHNKSPFVLATDELIAVIREALYRSESDLRRCTEWQGKNKGNGLWEDIYRSNSVLNEKYGVSIL